jgi:hypothetical protein
MGRRIGIWFRDALLKLQKMAVSMIARKVCRSLGWRICIGSGSILQDVG